MGTFRIYLPARLLLIVFLANAALFSLPTVSEYPLTAGSRPTSITLGPDGACWFIEQQGQRIGRITPTGEFNEYAVEHAAAGLNGIATGPDGALWFTQGAVDRIGRMNTAGLVTNEFPLPAGSVPFGIVNGPDGALWFTEQGTGKIGRLTPSFAFTEFPVPWANSQLFEITVGWGGALWFTDGSGNIGEISTAGAFARYPIPTASGAPRGITAGPDFAVWFTETAAGKVGRITVGGQQSNSTNPPPGLVTEYNLPNAAAAPQGIVFGTDGAFWFTENSGNRLGRITLAGAITEYDLPSPASQPLAIVVGPDSALWFAEAAGRVGRASINTAPTFTEFPTREVLTGPAGITSGPDATLWFTATTSGIVGRANPNGTVMTLFQQSASFSPVSIVKGPDGKMWYANRYQPAVGNIDSSGKRTQYPVPLVEPYAIVAGPDGALWFTDSQSGRIGRVTMAGLVTVFPVDGAFSIRGITVGLDGALWCTVVGPQGGGIARVTITGAVTVYLTPTTNSGPFDITPGPDGALWFTENQAHKIGRITPDGQIMEFEGFADPTVSPGRIASGPDGALWFTDFANRIGRITTGGTITEYQIPSGPNGPADITAGPDGAMWFTELSANKIGRITTPSTAPPTTTRYFVTNPPGVMLTVDGVSYATPQKFTWPVGSRHSVGIVLPPTAVGIRYSFTGWSDGQPPFHTIETGPGPAVFVANYRIQYQITTSATPSGSGSIGIAPAPADGYYDGGTAVQLTAVANPGYQFAGWIVGSGASATNPLTVVIDGLRSVTALFTPASCVITLAASSASVGVEGGTGTFGVVAESGCNWTVSTDASWVTLNPQGAGNAIGTYTVAPNPGGIARSAVVTVAGQSFTITQGLSAVGVTPAAGSGQSQVFTIQFANPAGYQNLAVVNVLIASALDGRQACYLAYSQPLNVLYLVNDAGAGLLPGLVMNGTGSLSNGQCTVDGASSSAVGSGNILTLKLGLSFTTASSGAKVVYLASGDQSGHNSGWQALGTWKVPGGVPLVAAPAGVLPARSNSAGQTYTLTFTDSNGAADLSVVNVLINDFLNGINACYLAYDRGLNVLYLVNDSGNAISPALVPGSSGSLSNSQCTVFGTGSSAAVANGNTLTLALNLSFASRFSGNRVIYTAAQNSGWVASGTVTIP